MEYWMRRCIELAKKGTAHVRTNPLVGAVIVKDGRIIGEGYHEVYGGKHAEVNAIERATESVIGSTLFCNLEPCFHHGKQPPCVNAIIQNGISKVVIAHEDPNPLVGGQSVQLLRDLGVEVTVGVLEEEARLLNQDWIVYMTKQRPFVTMKVAQTLDGKVALSNGDSKWITSELSRAHGRGLRAVSQAMLVGSRTCVVDNPSLTVRDGISNDPDVFILDHQGIIPNSLNCFNAKRKVYIFVQKEPNLRNSNVTEYIVIPSENGLFNLPLVLQEIAARGYKNILLESGGTLSFSMLSQGLVDKIYLYIAPKIFGGSNSISSFMGEGVETVDQAFAITFDSMEYLGDDMLLVGEVEHRCLQD